jgi:RHS repeat-associated protein
VFDGQAGLHQNFLRDYDPASGRYVESDPLGLEGESYSTYNYVGANPVSFGDALGLTSNSFQDPLYATVLESLLDGVQTGGKCILDCLRKSLGGAVVSVFGGGTIGTMPAWPVPKPWLPNWITRGGVSTGVGKRLYTSVARVASVVSQGALGRRDPLTLYLQQLADAVKFDTQATVVRGAVRGGVVGALALVSYCSYGCALKESCRQ